MKLAPRLVIAIGSVAVVSTGGLGFAMREERRSEETARFNQEVRLACASVSDEIHRQTETDRKLITGACHSGELVDRTLVAIEKGELDDRRLALSALVPGQREAFDFDALILATDTGEILGADPRTLLGMPTPDAKSLVRGRPEAFLRAPNVRGFIARCRREGSGGRSVGLVGIRNMDPLLRRLGKTTQLTITAGFMAAPQAGDVVESTCELKDGAGDTLQIHVSKSKMQLYQTLAHVDQTVLFAALVATAVALAIAALLARSLGRPIAELASEAGKVAAGEARPLRVRGSGEIADLTAAFDKMIEDLESTRRRLAATSRVAAWREVARRVAHEVKNPLAPIRAAVETLRRLRARQDPAFDDYFDEATRTVLAEVHRISNIVTEFTRFARLPPPRPEATDLEELVQGVVQLHRANAGTAVLAVSVKNTLPKVFVDRDQIIQVMTNLVQNALDAVKAKDKGEVHVALESARERVYLTVTDNGPGIAPEMAARLFEPYATTKAQGTGLGLAIAQRIAIEHDGELACLPSAPGAVFRLVLPVKGPTAVSEMPSEAAPPSS